MHRNRTWLLDPTELRTTRNRILPIEGGDGSTLSLDFTTGVLDPRLTFTRSSNATFVNSSGLVATASNNTPRFDYDPTTGAQRGLLIEGSASNFAYYSEYINPNSAPWSTYWQVIGTGASVTPVSQADPAGNSAASRCVLGTSTVGRVFQGISTTAGQTYTLSFWAKSVSGNTSLHFWHYNSATGNYTALTATTSWQRYQVTILGRTGGGFVECGIANLTSNAATVDLWGLQLETGSSASSYIPTGASTGSRSDDFILSATSVANSRSTEFNLNDLASDVSSYGSWTAFIHYARSTNNKNAYPASVYARTSGNLGRIDMRDFSGNTVEVKTETRSVQTATVSASVAKVALACDGTNQPSSAVNGTSATLSSGTINAAIGVQWAQFGNSSAIAGSFNPVWLKQFKMWPYRLAPSALATLTTL